MGALNDRKVKSLGPGRHSDGDGLYLVVTDKMRKKWVFRYQLRGARKDMGLGAYPTVGLAQARVGAGDARKLIAQGGDPIAERRASHGASKLIPTFSEIAQLVIADRQARSSNEKVRYQWERHLGKAYCGALLDRPVNEITTLDLAKVLKPLVRDKPEVARKLYPAIRIVFDYARIKLRDDHGIVMLENPARWDDLRAIGVERPRTLSRGNHPSLSHEELPTFMSELRAREATAARALELLILTNVRTNVVLNAEWEQFDLERYVWTIPLRLLKDREHRDEDFRIPLSPRAVGLLLRMRDQSASGLVFPSHGLSRPLSNMAMIGVLSRMNPKNKPRWVDAATKRPITPHGFRATFRTWAEDTTGFPHALIQEAMGHQVGTRVDRAYRRTDALAKRRELMNAWDEYGAR